MPVPDVHVQRHTVTCRVVGDVVGGAAARTVRNAVTGVLVEELDAALGAVGLDGYWVIRRLPVHRQVAAAWSSTQVGISLARGLAAGVADVVRGGVDPAQALWFPDRAAFISRFLVDLAEGRAGGRWEYAQFANLLGDASAAPAALAVREPDEVATALMHLTPAEIEVLAAATDGQRLLEVLAVDETPTPQAVVAALRELVRAGQPPDVRALVLAVTAARASGLPLGRVAGTAQEVAGVVGLLVGTPAARKAVVDGDWREVAALAGATDAYLPLVRWSVEDRASLVAALEPVVAHVAPDAADEPARTPHGGGLLLIPLLDQLWGGTTPGFRLLVVAAALGRPAVITDPVLRLALEVPEDLDASGWLRAGTDHGALIVGRAAASLLADLGRRLPGMASASAPYLRRNVLDLDARVRVGTAPGDDVVAELGRPPLAVLLSMTGLDRSSFVGGGGSRWWLTT